MGSPGLRGKCRTVFAFVGLLLGAVGLDAVTAFSLVVQRTHGIGVRMALGMQSSAVVWLFVKRAVLPVGVGIGAGLAGAWVIGRLLQRFLIQAKPLRDSTVLVGIAVLLVAVSCAACFFPGGLSHTVLIRPPRSATSRSRLSRPRGCCAAADVGTRGCG